MILLVTLTCLSVVGPTLCAPANPVFTLTDSDFDHFLKDKDAMLVDFYAPWCSDCANLKPEFDSAAKDLAKQGKFVFAKIDCFGSGRSICENRFNVHSWPQLKVFRKGQYAGEYSGNQDRASIKRFMKSLLQQKVPENMVQDVSQSLPPPYGPGNPNEGPWYQNGWQFSRISGNFAPYPNPQMWHMG